MSKKRSIRDIVLLMFRDWKTLFLIITFDVLFILILLSLRFIQISFDNILFPLFSKGGEGNLIYSAFYVILEFLLVILAYSFFKYFIVKFMVEGFKKAEFELKSFFSFLRLNLIIFTPLVVVFMVIVNLMIMYFGNLLSMGGIDPFKFIFVSLGIGILFIVLFIYVYNLVNILHFAFLKEQILRKLFKKRIINSFRINSYKMYWNDFKIIFVVAVFLLIIHFFVKTFLFADFSSYIKNFGNYKMFVYGVITLAIYFILLFNRFNFCMDALNVYKNR